MREDNRHENDKKIIMSTNEGVNIEKMHHTVFILLVGSEFTNGRMMWWTRLKSLQLLEQMSHNDTISSCATETHNG